MLTLIKYVSDGMEGLERLLVVARCLRIAGICIGTHFYSQCFRVEKDRFARIKFCERPMLDLPLGDFDRGISQIAIVA